MRCRTVFHIRNTLGLSAGAQGFACERSRLLGGARRRFTGETPRPWASDGRGYATTPIPSWPLLQVARSLFPGASGRSGASGFRAVCRVFPGLSRRISCRQKIAPIFRRQKIRGGWIPSGCGEPLREPFSSLKAPYGCRGGRPSSPGPIRPCAAFPWLPTAITLLPPCAPRGFPAGSPQAHAGFSPGILPPKADEAGPWDSPGRNLGVPTARPSRGSVPVWPGLLKAFSRDPSREAHGKGMGDGGSGGGDGR
jgi:hypothetical protein